MLFMIIWEFWSYLDTTYILILLQYFTVFELSGQYKLRQIDFAIVVLLFSILQAFSYLL